MPSDVIRIGVVVSRFQKERGFFPGETKVMTGDMKHENILFNKQKLIKPKSVQKAASKLTAEIARSSLPLKGNKDVLPSVLQK